MGSRGARVPRGASPGLERSLRRRGRALAHRSVFSRPALRPWRVAGAPYPRRPSGLVARAGARLPRRVPADARHLLEHVPRPAVDDEAVRGFRDRRGDQRTFPLPARARPDRALHGIRPTHADRLRLRPRVGPRRSRPRRRRDRLGARHGGAFRRHRHRHGHHLDDDQRDGGHAARSLLCSRRAPRRAARESRRHGPERHPQGICCARHVHLPSGAIAAIGHRHLPFLRRASSALEHDQHLGLPHPRGWLDRGARGRLHARQRHRLHGGRRLSGARCRRVRASPLVLFQRPQPPSGRSRQVQGGAAALGSHHEGSVRRD